MIPMEQSNWITKGQTLAVVFLNLWLGTVFAQVISDNESDALFRLPIHSELSRQEGAGIESKKTRSLKTPRDSDGRFVKDTLLEYDATHKDIHPDSRSEKVELFFEIANPTLEPITITTIMPSCGCTAAKSPELPWTLNPGKADLLHLTVDLMGKSGVISKSVTVLSTAGRKSLSFKLHIPELTGHKEKKSRSMAIRMSNIDKARRNRQVVFQGHCRSCHFNPSEGKEGEELFQSACGICHDTLNRASMVPDLEKKPEGITRNHAYWKEWIAIGKEKTLMPGFHEDHGGPLSTQRIEKLAAFLVQKYQTNSH